VKVAAPVMAEPVGEIPIAVIAVVPVEFSVASPEELIVATFTSLDTQVTEFVTSCVGGVTPVKVPIAMYCAVSPVVATVWEGGIIVIALSPGTVEEVTVTVAELTMTAPLVLRAVAVMVVVPGPVAVTSPEELTLPTWVSLDTQVA